MSGQISEVQDDIPNARWPKDDDPLIIYSSQGNVKNMKSEVVEPPRERPFLPMTLKCKPNCRLSDELVVRKVKGETTELKMNDVIQSVNGRKPRNVQEFYDTIKKGVVEIKILRPVPLIRSPLRILQKLPMANDISVTGYEYAICYLGLFEGFKLGLRICARYSKIYIREVKPKSVARKILKTGDAILVVDDVEVTTNEQAIERMEKRLQQKNWIELVVERPISHAAKECVRKRLREGNTVTINPGMPAEVREICEAQIERMNSEKEVECKGILRTEKYKTRRLSIAKLSQEIPIGEEPQLSQMLRPILNPEEQIDLIRCKRAQRRARRSRPSDSSNR